MGGKGENKWKRTRCVSRWRRGQKLCPSVFILHFIARERFVRDGRRCCRHEGTKRTDCHAPQLRTYHPILEVPVDKHLFFFRAASGECLLRNGHYGEKFFYLTQFTPRQYLVRVSLLRWIHNDANVRICVEEMDTKRYEGKRANIRSNSPIDSRFYFLASNGAKWHSLCSQSGIMKL